MRKANQKKYRPRIKGICADAAALGYSYRHLAMVIRGDRHSPRALHAYQQLKASQKNN